MKRSFLLGILLLAACSLRQSPENSVGSARATITQVPPMVSCVQIIAAGGLTVTDNFDVQPGQSTVLNLKNLPIGNLTFTAFAYQAACASLAGTQANWASAPAVATIYPGQFTNLSLTLEQVGGANVGVNFDYDGGVDMAPVPDLAASPDLSVASDLAPACLPSGASCLGSTVLCCMGTCNFPLFRCQ
jgi:hypothetical protein